MTREFKPGDVAMVECSDGKWRRAGYRRTTAAGGPEAWEFEDGSRRRVNESRTRPLAVIDPEGRDDADRLAKLLVEAMHRAGDARSAANGVHPATVAAALREYVSPTPAKPDEPQGLGAVAIARNGDTFVRIDTKGSLVWSNLSGHLDSWDDLPAVKVLSEGVTP